MGIDTIYQPGSIYRNDPDMKARVKARVKQMAPEWAVRAVIVNGIHTSRTDRKPHATVDYFGCTGMSMRDHVYLKRLTKAASQRKHR